MVVLIAGSSHTGKTLLAQRLLEKYKYPYLSIDHMKMGLIRSKNTNLTIEEDNKLTDYLWGIVKEIVKTNIKNNQNLIIEGCYIPLNWKNDFEERYLKQIKYTCLIMTEKYIDNNYKDIKLYENAIEDRKYQDNFYNSTNRCFPHSTISMFTFIYKDFTIILKEGKVWNKQR